MRWAEVPTDRVVRLVGPAYPELLPATLAEAPAVIAFEPPTGTSPVAMVDAVLATLDAAAIEMYPAWLPAAENITGRDRSSIQAVRVIARRTAATSEHFGPFLADLAVRALGFRPARRPAFAPEVRAAGLARVIAAGLDRPPAVVLVRVHAELPTSADPALLTAAQWLVGRGNLGVWLVGRPLTVGDPVETVTVGTAVNRSPMVPTAVPPPSALPSVLASSPEVPAAVAPLAAPPAPRAPTAAPAAKSIGSAPAVGPTKPTKPTKSTKSVGSAKSAESVGSAVGSAKSVGSVPAAGRPHPASQAEQALESALARCDWASGRSWNQPLQTHPLTSPVRVDLLWRRERCVVEIDGREHRSGPRFAADRRRDVQLQLRGYVVLRFTNAQVRSDLAAVVTQIEQCIRGRRLGMPEEQRHAG